MSHSHIIQISVFLLHATPQEECLKENPFTQFFPFYGVNDVNLSLAVFDLQCMADIKYSSNLIFFGRTMDDDIIYCTKFQYCSLLYFIRNKDICIFSKLGRGVARIFKRGGGKVEIGAPLSAPPSHPTQKKCPDFGHFIF